MINFLKLFCRHEYIHEYASCIFDKTTNRWSAVRCQKCRNPRNKDVADRISNLNYIQIMKELQEEEKNKIIKYRFREIRERRFLFSIKLMKYGLDNEKIKEILKEYDYHENIKERSFMKTVYNIEIGI